MERAEERWSASASAAWALVRAVPRAPGMAGMGATVQAVRPAGAAGRVGEIASVELAQPVSSSGGNALSASVRPRINGFDHIADDLPIGLILGDISSSAGF